MKKLILGMFTLASFALANGNVTIKLIIKSMKDIIVHLQIMHHLYIWYMTGME